MGSDGFPLLPLDSIDWDHLGFELVDVNGHIECHYSTETSTWSYPVFVEDAVLHIHGLPPALNFAQQIFEGLKAFRTPSGIIQLFRPSVNAARFAHSAHFVFIPRVPVELFLRAVHVAVGLNTEFVPPHASGAALYVRPIAFASSETLGLRLARRYTFCVYVLPAAPLHGALDQGVKALVVGDFDRAAPLGTGSAKVGGNYGPVLGLIARANADGYQLTLHLDSASDSMIDEFSTSAFVGLQKDVEVITLVVSDSKQIVRSVTVDSICEIARSFGWRIERKPWCPNLTLVNIYILFSDLPTFTEVYAAGTAAVLVPVRCIERRSTGHKIEYTAEYQEPGSAFARLSSKLRNVQQGLVEDEFGWVEVVDKPGLEDNQNYQKDLMNKQC